MTMTGRTTVDRMRPEFDLETENTIPWGHEYGALDAALLIPAGSTQPCFKGRHGFGVPNATGREKRA